MDDFDGQQAILINLYKRTTPQNVWFLAKTENYDDFFKNKLFEIFVWDMLAAFDWSMQIHQ